MPIESHIDSLKSRHRELDEKLDQMRSSSSTPENDITQLKRQKLQLKDRIQQLSA